ncbi:MAG: efflux transporter periplasmic adaptor subunit, partial [Stenotrophomonas sp.]
MYQMGLRMFGRFAVTVAGGTVLALALAGCNRKNAEAPRQAAGAVLVTTQVVETAPWSDTLQANGTAKARESIIVTAKVSEIIDKVHFESGQQVAT